MAGSFVIMTASEDSMSERRIGGNVDMSLVGENALSILPVRETGAESWRN